ncbi:hypothetical protein ACRAWG_28675 [Methylobacterium sp. P31]
MANVQNIRRMVARLWADQELQAILDRNAFVAADAATMILDLNSWSQDYRQRVAFQWCEAYATGRWRRCVCERRGYAMLDKAIFEFEHQADAESFNDWLADHGW